MSFMVSANCSNSAPGFERGPSLCFRRRKIASNLQRSLVRGLALQASLALRWPRAVEFSPPACLRPPAQLCAQGRSSHRIARPEAMFHVGLYSFVALATPSNASVAHIAPCPQLPALLTGVRRGVNKSPTAFPSIVAHLRTASRTTSNFPARPIGPGRQTILFY